MTLNWRGLYPISYLNFARSGLTANDSLLLVAQWPVWNAVDRFSCHVAKSSGSLWVIQFWPMLCRASLTEVCGLLAFHDILGEEYCFLPHTAERNALPQDYGLSLGCCLLHASYETAFIQLPFFIKDSVVFFFFGIILCSLVMNLTLHMVKFPLKQEKLEWFCASGSPFAGDFPVVSPVGCTYKSSSAVEFHQVLSEGDCSTEMGLWMLSALALLWCFPCFMWKYGKAVFLGQAL